MNMKLYERNSYLKEYVTTVTKCFSDGDKIYVCLKDTIFFPEEGGQNADTGSLSYEGKTLKILHGEVTGSKDSGIRYLVDAPVAEGTEVTCLLDWKDRFDRMQNHGGEHILSGIIHNIYGYDNIGFHLSDDDYVTLTVNGKLNDEQIEELERKANQAVYDNLPITDSYPSIEEIRNISYRSKIEIEGQIRLITIGDKDSPLDVCACCAPHVKSTGEIGIIKVFSHASSKGGTQLSILCGRRALELMTIRLDELDLIARSFSTHTDNVPDMIEKLKSDNALLKVRLGEIAEDTIIKSIETSGKRCVFTDIELSPVSMKNIYNHLTSNYDGYVGLFVGDDTSGYRYNAGSRDRDSKELVLLMKDALNAKGGGSSEMISGRLDAAKNEIEAFWNGIG